MTFDAYYFVSFWAALYMTMTLPTKLRPMQNFTGSVIISLFGFIVWPFLLFATFKSLRK